MISLIFGIWDKKAEAFIDIPFFMDTKGVAIRAFADMAKKTDNRVGQHPEDYSLFHIGDYNHANGAITAADEPTRSAVHLVNATDLLERK